MRKRWWTSILFFMAGCSVNGPHLSWPAHIASMDVPSSEESDLLNDVSALNQLLSKSVLSVGSSQGSPIYVTEVESFPSVPNTTYQNAQVICNLKTTRLSASTTQIAGRAILSSRPQQCEIQLASFLMDGSHEDLLKAVFIHEVGHCGGLLHLQQTHEVMSPETLPFSQYTAAQLQLYVQSFLNSIAQGYN